MIKYMITDGHGSYIRLDQFTNKYTPVKSMALGDVWDQRHIAVNVMKNCLGKKDRRKFKILEIESDAALAKMQQISSDTHKKTVKEIRKEKESFIKSVATKEVGESRSDEWKTGVGTIYNIIKDSEERKTELLQELSTVDLEIEDIKHYIEFTSLNAYQGWLACSMLKNSLKKRRRIKDELQVVNALGNCKITSDMMIDIENAIKNMNNKKYVPRVLFELFE